MDDEVLKQISIRDLKLSIWVTAGVLPGEEMREYTKIWHITSSEFEDLDQFLAKAGAANLYCLQLQNPTVVNWVRLEWLYY